jgi:CheY-like chemotaxis protein
MGIAETHQSSPDQAASPEPDYDAIIERLRVEFVEFAGDALDELDSLIESGHKQDDAPAHIIDAVRRGGHNLKGMGSSFGFPLITLLAHRMEDYFAGRQDLERGTLEDAQCFVDLMREALLGRLDGVSEAEVVRTLPAKANFDVAEVVKQDVEVLLAMPRGAATRIIEREFQACGYRVVTVPTPFAAIEMAVRTSPDLIVASAVMEDLSGVDLACALNAMPVSQDLPFILLTSLNTDDAIFSALPSGVPLVRKGDKFADDLAEALAALGIA